MKKVLFIAVAALGFITTQAQEVKFGAKAGLNLSNFTGDVEDNSMKVGFQVGALAEIKISDKFSVQPEVLFSTQGANYKYSDDSLDEVGNLVTKEIKGSINISYLNIPVMAKYYVVEGFSIEAGPQIGFLMSAKDKFEDKSEDSKDDFNSTDFGLNFGLGYDVIENINVGVRYTAGLSNIAKDSGDNKLANSNIAVAVAYKF